MDKQLSFFASPATASKKIPAQNKHDDNFIIYIDGAARGNPGPAGAGIFLTGKVVPPLKKGIFLGEKTNNQAEYLALALAVFYAYHLSLEYKMTLVTMSIFSDSELLVKQMNGEYKIKNLALQEIKKCIDPFLHHFDYTFTHVLREKNKEADHLANVGIEKKQKPPAAFLKILYAHGLSI